MREKSCFDSCESSTSILSSTPLNQFTNAYKDQNSPVTDFILAQIWYTTYLNKSTSTGKAMDEGYMYVHSTLGEWNIFVLY